MRRAPHPGGARPRNEPEMMCGSLSRSAEPAASTEAAAAGCSAAGTRTRGPAAGTPARLGAGLRSRSLTREQSFALGALARQFPRPPHRLRLLAHTLLRGLLVVIAQLHLAEDALALHLLLQRLESLIDVVVADLYQQAGYLGSVE